MRRLSVRRKLFYAILGPSIGALILIGSFSLWFDVYMVRQAIEREARVQANLLALALRGPLSLDDTLALQETIDALKGDPEVILGAVYSAETNLLASYQTPRAGSIPAVPQPLKNSDEFFIVHEIKVGQEPVGTLLVGVSLDRYHNRLKWYAFGAAASVAVFSIISAIVAGILRRQIAAPLTSLSKTAQTISEQKDYGVRAPDFREEEFQHLSGAFNHMLSEIGSQNAALTQRNHELRTANNELEAFTYSVSHDLRTPLRSISSYSNILLESESASLSKEGSTYLERIEKNALRMSQLIDDLLAFSKIDAQAMNVSEIDLTEQVQEVWAEMAPELKDREIKFQLEDLGKAQADASLLKQVFVNLIGNAVKYSRGRKPAHIQVGCQQQGGQKIYFVKDNGVGFEMEYATKLFRIFQRLHKQKEFEGTGVGLAIVERIIQRHGGKIWAEAEVNRGATFYFTLS